MALEGSHLMQLIHRAGFEEEAKLIACSLCIILLSQETQEGP